ncbi:MAG: hypothetical protein LBB94_05425 [Clostridiales bacterium]|jgi:hypothetical protein|nr:hypothetical protein [Clostridiales bacterium]
MTIPFLSVEELRSGSAAKIPEDKTDEQLTAMLELASRMLDSICFCRISARELTERQTELIKAAMVLQITHMLEAEIYGDSGSAMRGSWSLGDVSMSAPAGKADNTPLANYLEQRGIARNVYSLLLDTGLGWRGV